MAKRVDENQKEIVAFFRSLGASVQILSDLGKGCPDLIVGIFKKNYLVEVKNGKKPLSAQKLTPAEQIFFDTWHGQVDVINSIEQAEKFIKNIQG